jgi:hypothetical protein
MTEKNTDGVGDQEEIIIYRARGCLNIKELGLYGTRG